jgi:Uma2 family endonuclease
MAERIVGTKAGIAVDEFIRLYDEVGPFELIEGERIILHPPVFGHSHIGMLLTTALNTHGYVHQLGEAFHETAFVLTDNPKWVKGSRVPDVLFIRRERLLAYKAAIPDWREKPLMLIPDLVVEIVSANDAEEEVDAKVARYLKDGVRVVWVIRLEQRSVMVHQTGNEPPLTFKIGDALTGGEVIPGFTIPVATLFE